MSKNTDVSLALGCGWMGLGAARIGVLAVRFGVSIGVAASVALGENTDVFVSTEVANTIMGVAMAVTVTLD